MNKMFLVLEKMEYKHKLHFKTLYDACIKETKIQASDSFIHNLYNINDSFGVIAFNIYGDPVGYILYTVSDTHPLFLINFCTHSNFRRKGIMTRLLSHVFYYEQPKLMSTIVDETFLEVQLFLKASKFCCTKIINRIDADTDNLVFVANNWNPISRISSYAPNMF